MKLYLSIPDCQAFDAAQKFFSAKGDSLYLATPDYRNQALVFEVDDQEDADETEKAVTEAWLDFCAENNLDNSHEWEGSIK